MIKPSFFFCLPLLVIAMVALIVILLTSYTEGEVEGVGGLKGCQRIPSHLRETQCTQKSNEME